MTNDELMTNRAGIHGITISQSDFAIPSCFVNTHWSLVFAFARRSLFALMARFRCTSPGGQSGLNERRRNDRSLTLWRERFEGIEIKIVEG